MGSYICPWCEYTMHLCEELVSGSGQIKVFSCDEDNCPVTVVYVHEEEESKNET